MARFASRAALACLCALALSSCGRSFKDLVGLEKGARSYVEPTTVAELQAAIIEYQKVVDEKVHASDRVGYYYKMLGLEYMKRQMYGEAYKAYSEAIEISPANATLFYYAGVCAAYVSKAQASLADGTEAKRLDYMNRAERAYKRSLELDPENSRTIYALAVVYALELNRPDDAAPLLEDYMAKNAKDVNSRFLMARVRYAQGRYEDAVALYDWIIGNSVVEAERTQAQANRDQAQRMAGGSR